MVEIIETERKIEKIIKRNENNIRDLWDNVKCPNIRIIGVPEEEDKKKDHEKILEKIIFENFPKNGEGNRHPSPRNPESSKLDKSKAEHLKTHINQINEDQAKKENIKINQEKTTNNIQGNSHRITADLSIEILQVRRE